jgi:hypothetical protein
MKTIAKVNKLSESGKTMLVQVKSSEYQIGYTFGWCANPDQKYSKDDILPNFAPIGLEPVVDKEGEPVLHEDGSSVMRWKF